MTINYEDSTESILAQVMDAIEQSKQFNPDKYKPLADKENSD